MDIRKKTKSKNTDSGAKTDLTLRKHVGLIHCENKLTLVQRKICNILLFNALDTIHEQDVHDISLKQLCNLVGYNSNDISLIKTSIKSLISTVIEWNLLEDNKFINEENLPEEVVSWNASSLLAGASIKQGTIRYSYSPQIKTVLSSLEIYGRINLFVQSKFNSSYSLVLYENCVRFKNIKKTSWFSLQLFRSLLGVSKEKYPQFKEFKRNVISVAVNEINQKSDIFIEPCYKKQGRQIVAVQFLLSDNENYQPTFKRVPRIANKNEEPNKDAALVESLKTEFDFSTKQSRQVVSAYEAHYILEKINLVKKKKKVDNLGAYLMAALKNDYKQKEQQKTKQIEKKEINTSIRESKEAAQISSLQNKYRRYKTNHYVKKISEEISTMQKKIKSSFALYLKPKGIILSHYRKAGFLSPFVMPDFINFIEKSYSSLCKECLTFDEYITSEEETVI